MDEGGDGNIVDKADDGNIADEGHDVYISSDIIYSFSLVYYVQEPRMHLILE